ncbi:MAG: hypothetical protein ACFFHV_07995 [Promethearchaeota archaeon]
MNDFQIFYDSGRQIFINPANLYNVRGFRYMPSFAMLFAVSISLIPYKEAYYIFFIINYILGVISIIEFNKILSLMNIKKKSNRAIFLLIISNGYFVYYQFYFNQSKYLTFVILLFILRRELQFRIEEKPKELNFYIINYGLIVFAIGMAPYFIFFLLIYLFQDIPRKDIFKRESRRKYLIIIIWFILQNILFLIYPFQIISFLDGFNRPQRRPNYFKIIYLREWIELSPNEIKNFTILFSIILFIVTLILMFNDKLLIEEKFGYFAIAYILIGVFSYTFLLGLILYSFVLLLFAPHLSENYKGIEFITKNRIVIIGISSILAIFFAWSSLILYNFIPGLKEYPMIIFYYLRWVFLLSIMIYSLIKLKFNKINIKEVKKKIFNID